MKKYLWISILIIVLSTCGNEGLAPLKNIPNFEKNTIKVNPQQSRPYIFTNKESAFFYSETGKIRKDSLIGFYVMARKYLDDYDLKIDGQPLLPQSADSVKMYFDNLTRYYPDNLIERVTLLDKLNCLLIEIHTEKVCTIDFIPLISRPEKADNYFIDWQDRKNMFILGSKTDSNKGNQVKYPSLLGIKFIENTLFSDEKKLNDHQYLPPNQVGRFRSTSNHLNVAIIIGDEKKDLDKLVEQVIKNPVYFTNQKKVRLAKLFANQFLKTNQPHFDNACQWALVSLDQLVMNQSQPITGIYAGLPQSTHLKARDSFISLPGAYLVTGRLEEAKEMLLTFARFQSKNRDRSDFGRIPNQIADSEIVYNSADSTPWFVRALWEYYLYSGDKKFLEQMYSVVERSIEGTLQYHTDTHYFLTHDDAETWMDAKSAQSAWSPRGNRAIELQVLWYAQLLIGSQMSGIFGKIDNQSRWNGIAQELQRKFNHFFWDERRNRLYDHLNIDGSPDNQIRPNNIFAITIPHLPLIKPEQELMVLKEVVSRLTYPYGVATLWQHDPDFHPYYIYPQFYPKDAAYHNGTVWSWLSGPVISGLIKYGYSDLAYELFESESFQILNWGTVGTLSEIFDAIPPKGQKIPFSSGNVIQALSLAEYLRNVYQDFIGILPRVPEQKITLAPRLPKKLSQVTCRIPIFPDSLILNIRKMDNDFELTVDYFQGQRNWIIELNYPESRTKNVIVQASVSPGDRLQFNINFHRKTPILVNQQQVAYRVEETFVPEGLFSYLSFSIPQLDRNLRSLQPRF